MKKLNFFSRINNGKAVTLSEILRLKVLSRDTFIKLAEHKAISFIVGENRIRRLEDEDIVQNIWVVCYTKNPALTVSGREKILTTTRVTDEQVSELNNAFDYMDKYFYEAGKNKKLISVIRHKTHIVMIAYMAFLAINRDMSVEQYIEKAMSFFKTEGLASISDAYNKATSSGISRAENVRIRMNEIEKHLDS